MNGSSNPLHYLEPTNPLGNVLINSLPHVQPTSSSSSESTVLNTSLVQLKRLMILIYPLPFEKV